MRMAGLRPIIEDKGKQELAFWRKRVTAEGILSNAHYEPLYTTMFELPKSFFDRKRILDIGCGPRGSLEWAVNARQRLGLDPLAAGYRAFGTASHRMVYVGARAEQMPFVDGQFDVVTSLNSLDHVDNLLDVLDEVSRVTRPGGSFLLEVEVGHEPTPTEPNALWFDVTDVLLGSYELIYERRFEMPIRGHSVHDAYGIGVTFDEVRRRHPGVLVAHLRRIGNGPRSNR